MSELDYTFIFEHYEIRNTEGYVGIRLDNLKFHESKMMHIHFPVHLLCRCGNQARYFCILDLNVVCCECAEKHLRGEIEVINFYE